MHFNMDMGNYNRVVLYFVHHKFMRRYIHKTMKNTRFITCKILNAGYKFAELPSYKPKKLIITVFVMLRINKVLLQGGI